jgi:hypothetical protein
MLPINGTKENGGMVDINTILMDIFFLPLDSSSIVPS